MVNVRRGRLPDPLTAPERGETTEAVLTMAGVRVEHILSGELEAPVVYRQDHDEWVVVLAGAAVLEVGGERLSLSEGEWVLLAREVSHRLISTVPGTEWLAVHTPRVPTSDPGHPAGRP